VEVGASSFQQHFVGSNPYLVQRENVPNTKIEE